MFERKRIIAVTDRQQRVMVRGLSDARNGALRDGKPTEDLDEVILKAINAPIMGAPRNRRFRGERSRSEVSELSPKAEAKDTKLAATKKRRAEREAR